MTPNVRKLETALMIEYTKVCLALALLRSIDIEFFSGRLPRRPVGRPRKV
jgi:hypothetical protein